MLAVKIVFAKKDLNLHTYKLFQEQRYKKYKLNDLFSFQTQSESKTAWNESREKYVRVFVVYLRR